MESYNSWAWNIYLFKSSLISLSDIFLCRGLKHILLNLPYLFNDFNTTVPLILFSKYLSLNGIVSLMCQFGCVMVPTYSAKH